MTQAFPGSSDLPLLCQTLDRLDEAGAACLVFGGWAEELLGLVPRRPHGDIDLLLPAPSLAALDALLAASAAGLEQIMAKRFAHKRAFTVAGVVVEVMLVEPGPDGPLTRFWGDVPFRWLTPLAGCVRLPRRRRAVPVVTAANLVRYRACHRETQPWRWRDPAVLVP